MPRPSLAVVGKAADDQAFDTFFAKKGSIKGSIKEKSYAERILRRIIVELEVWLK